MICAGCSVENPQGARFCQSCGAVLLLTCPRCSEPAAPGARFCTRCGGLVPARPSIASSADRAAVPAVPASLPPAQQMTGREPLAGERKQITVLFADIVGSTALIRDLDAEDAQQLLDGAVGVMIDAVHRYEGTVSRSMGDGIMALFGAPIAHEDHAQRACFAAFAIHEGIVRYASEALTAGADGLMARVGINSGEVIVRLISDDLHVDYTAMGPTVHLAARMEQLASAGTSVITRSTLNLVHASVDVRPLGALPVKGLEQPVDAFELTGQQASARRFEALARRGLTQFVGRDRELQHLIEACDAARAGSGRVVSIVGEAGIGKSRLLHELRRHLVREGVDHFEGSCFAHGEVISFLPFIRVVRELFEIRDGDQEKESRHKLEAGLSELPIDAPELMPFLANLLGLELADLPLPSATPEVIRQRTVDALKQVVLGLARHRPVVLVLEDVHWTDRASEEVVAAIVHAMADVPLAFVLAFRPEYVAASTDTARHDRIVLERLPSASSAEMVRTLLSRSYADSVRLQPLPADVSRTMLQDLLKAGRVPKELEDLIAAKTDGNPFFVEELTRSLLETGDLELRNGNYILTRPLESLHVPATVQGVLLSRIDRLSDTLKHVLQVASAIGRVFSVQILDRVTQLGHDLGLTLTRLQDLEFVYPLDDARHERYSFKHVLTQEAVYETLLRARRERYHAMIGQSIEAIYADALEEQYEVLAHHYVRSADRQKALEYLEAVNVKAIQGSAMTEAKAYFDQAMTLLDSSPELEANQVRRIRMLNRQGWMMNALLRLPEYYGLLSRYEAALGSAANEHARGTYLARMGWCEWSFGEFDRAIETTTRAVQLCERLDDLEGAGQAYVHMQWSQMCMGDFADALASGEHALQAVARQFNIRWHLFAHAGRSLTLSWMGRWEASEQAGLTALRRGEASVDDSVIAFAAFTLAICHTARGDFRRAVEYGELAIQRAPTPGDRAWASATWAAAAMRDGEFARSIEILEQTVEALRSARFIWSEVYAVKLGEAYWRAGQHKRGDDVLEEVVRRATACRMLPVLCTARYLLAEVALSRSDGADDLAKAESNVLEAIRIAREIGAENELALATACLGRLRLRCGQVVQARADLATALEIFERLGTLHVPAEVRHLLAKL